jgi:ribosomal protein L37AE/L43A
MVEGSWCPLPFFSKFCQLFLDLLARERLSVSGCSELPATSNFTYYGFVDTSGAIGDAMTLGIGHAKGGVAVLDLLREIHPPFSPEAAVKEFCADLKRYRCYSVTGDRYAGEWPRERFSVNGILYTLAEKNRSEIYLDFLPMLNSRAVKLLDIHRLTAQLAGLVRRTRSGGRDNVDHKPGQHDDLCNVAAGVLVLVAIGGNWEFGLLAYDKQVASDKSGKQDFKIKVASPVTAPESSSQQSATTCPSCPSCGTAANVNRVDVASYVCNQCATTFGTPRVAESFNRDDFLKFSGGRR